MDLAAGGAVAAAAGGDGGAAGGGGRRGAAGGGVVAAAEHAAAAAEVVLAKAAAKEAVQLRKATRAHVCCVPGCGKRLASASSLRNHAKTHVKRLKMTPAVEG